MNRGVGFSAGQYLVLLVVPLVSLGFSAFRYRRRIRALSSLVGAGAGGAQAARYRLSYVLSSLLFAMALAFGAIAFAGPHWGLRTVNEYLQGADVVLALDSSRSMDARDVVPSRLGAAKRIAAQVVEGAPGVRFAAAAGKGAAVLALPLTDDTEAVLSYLDSLGSRSLNTPGTDLGALVERALAAFVASSPARKLVVLFSDGESLSGNLADASVAAQAAGAAVVAVAFGTAEGATVPLSPEDPGAGALADGSGKAVMTYLNETPLRALASSSGGLYVDGSRSDAAVTILSLVRRMDASGSGESWHTEARPRDGFFLVLALLCLLGAKLAEAGPLGPAGALPGAGFLRGLWTSAAGTDGRGYSRRAPKRSSDRKGRRIKGRAGRVRP